MFSEMLKYKNKHLVLKIHDNNIKYFINFLGHDLLPKILDTCLAPFIFEFIFFFIFL